MQSASEKKLLLAWLAAKERVSKAEQELTEAQQKEQALRIEAQGLFSQDTFLSKRERDVLGGIVLEKQNKEIAAELHISVRTVKFHVSSLLRKLGKTSRYDITASDAIGYGGPS